MKIRVAPIDEKMRALEIVWPCSKVITGKKISELIQVERMKKGRKRPKRTLVKVIKNDMSIKGVSENMTLDRVEWRQRIHMTDPN